MTIEDDSTKYCGGCKKNLSRSEFHKNKGKPDGLTTQCKECARARANHWFSENQERGKAVRAAYYEANRDRMVAQMRAYRSCHIDRWRQYDKDRRYDPCRMLQFRAWRKQNPDKVRRVRIISEAKRRSASGVGITWQDIEVRLVAQRFKCAICRRSLREKYHVDHIMPLSKGGENTPQNIQLLCPSCNMRKSAKHPLDYMRELGRLL